MSEVPFLPKPSISGLKIILLSKEGKSEEIVDDELCCICNMYTLKPLDLAYRVDCAVGTVQSVWTLD